MKDVMLDLETMSNKSNGVICAIGAVEFDLATGETGKEFYTTVDIQSCLDAGLRVEGSTIGWWLTQNEAARNEIAAVGATVLNTALLKLSTGAGFNWNYAKVWGNSARFDLGILENAYHACKMQAPWKFYNERDVRTLVAFAPEIKANYPKPETAHHAIQDCHYQIGYCCEIYKTLRPVTA